MLDPDESETVAHKRKENDIRMTSSSSSSTASLNAASQPPHQGQYGVTPPISIEFPSQLELEMTDKLTDVLRSLNVFEHEEESRRRYLL